MKAGGKCCASETFWTKRALSRFPVNCGATETLELVLSSESNEWYTPARYVDAARLTLGSIDLDPASCEAANKIVKAKTFYSKDRDGLETTVAR